MDSTTLIVELTKQIDEATIILFQNQWAKSVDFTEINHACFARFRNLIQQGINMFPIILESLQSKD
ncbi:hypothetical protein D8674_005607 [Pyrus ussuriensis x Pyrus communis]|uniref:Uncharacterized protein n=1 Tax=Pyrus ussuriensis x Pyrus communis TaxID=2448454 RepID=A0A5N5FWY4_9ROSA|nr:hypothetical protein D8674_005607 [Pyrus ussuriensis x Pyrus communis]